jgi:Icc-related predicted phosphoesterase
MARATERVRLAATADLHCTRAGQGTFQPLLSPVNDQADVLLLCGDLTDHGLPEEAQVLARELTSCIRIPIVGVLGNHDYESGKPDEVRRILVDAGVHMLDGDVFEIQGVGFAGTKGFAGGFGRRALQPWGEENIKRFVQEAVEEATKLGAALARLRTAPRIAVLHYAPIQATVEGEPPEIFAFLGSSRLEEPLDHYGVSMVFHGHAHHGSPEGRTRANIPVYNVSIQLLQANGPGRQPFRVVEIPREPIG